MKIFTRMLTGLIAILLLVNLLVYPAFSAAQVDASPPPPGLLSDSPSEEGKGTGLPHHPAERRSRRARLNLDRLPARGRGLAPQSEANTLRFNLFPDVDLLAEIEASGDAPLGGTYLRGRLAGQPFSEWTLIEQDGLVSASIHADDKYYQIVPLADGEIGVQEIDLGAMPPEAEPLLPDLPPSPLASPALPDTSTLADGSPTIDVLVVYTAQAKGSVPNINDLISLAVIETNAGYQNSQINQRVRLVHAAEISYNEGYFNWGTTLEQLTGTNDRVMDEVHTLRNRYGADAVVLLVGSGGGMCGIAWLMNSLTPAFASHAFAVVSTDCATGYYSFGHELGHLMGATHDRQNSTSPGVYSFSYGYQDPGSAFRTVMAYNCPIGCPRINYWSNPDVLFTGKLTGVNYLAGDSADNHLTLNQTAAVVSAFRTASAEYTDHVYLPMVIR